MDPSANALDENRRLRRTMRDLVALSTLPAVWIGLRSEQIARSLGDVLLNTLSLDLIYVRLAGVDGEGVAEVVRRKKRSDTADVPLVRTAFAHLLTADQTGSSVTLPDPFGGGSLHVTVTRFGGNEDQGVLVSGSFNADFPTERDRALLGVGANQTAIVLQRRRAEEQVQEQREWLRVTLASIGDAVIATDIKGRVTYLNAVAEELTGWTPNQAEGMPLDTVFPILNETTRRPVENPVERVLREGIVVGLANHTVLIARDGTERPIDDSAAPIRDRSGKMLGVVLIFKDITEQRRLERQRNARLAVTSALSDAASVEDAASSVLRAVCENLAWDVGFFWTLNADGNGLSCRQSWHRPGVPVDEFEAASCSRTFERGQGLPGRVWASSQPAWILDIAHDGNFARLASAVRYGLQSAFACPVTVNERMLGVIEFFAKHVYEPDADLLEMMGTVAGSIGQFIERKTAEDVLRRSEQSSRFLAEASAELGGVVDHESTLQKVVNLAVPYFADWSAVDLADEDGNLRRLAVAHQDAEKIALVRELMREYPPDPKSPVGVYAVLRTGKPELVGEITDAMLVQQARDERHLEMVRSLNLKSYICVPLVISGKTLGLLTFATAESGRKYAEADLALAMDLAHRAAVAIENVQLYQALRETDRRKDEFLATLAHELRNPLAPVRNALQILKTPRLDPQTVQRSREMMERQVQHLVRLVDDLLDVSRVMRGKIELRRERIELATVVTRAVETVQPIIDAQGHRLNVRVSSDSLLLDADPVRLVQVVGNLLSNAAKYTEPGGRIWLAADRDGDMAVLRVRDTGIGIAPHMLPRIFELFVQVDHASTRTQGGLGIGLTLVRNLVEMHNGIVQARSDGLGHGSEFVVKLPLVVQAVDSSRTPNAGQQADEFPRPSGKRLLVVDDNQDAANSLAMLLKLQSHEVRVAYSGMAALEMIKAYTPDVVFLDIGMPGMDGYEVARRIRQMPGLGEVVLAALTGWGQQEDRRRTAEAGFDHHLVKPPEPELLERLVASEGPHSSRIRKGESV